MEAAHRAYKGGRPEKAFAAKCKYIVFSPQGSLLQATSGSGSFAPLAAMITSALQVGLGVEKVVLGRIRLHDRFETGSTAVHGDSAATARTNKEAVRSADVEGDLRSGRALIQLWNVSRMDFWEGVTRPKGGAVGRGAHATLRLHPGDILVMSAWSAGQPGTSAGGAVHAECSEGSALYAVADFYIPDPVSEWKVRGAAPGRFGLCMKGRLQVPYYYFGPLLYGEGALGRVVQPRCAQR